MQCMQFWLQVVCSLLILHPLSVNNTSRNCFIFAFVVNKIFAVYAVKDTLTVAFHPLTSWWLPFLMGGNPSSPSWWEYQWDNFHTQPLAFHSYLQCMEVQAAKNMPNAMSAWHNFPRVTLWPGALMRVRSEKDTIIVFTPAVLNAGVFSLFQAQDTS